MKRLVIGTIFLLATVGLVRKSITSVEYDWGLFLPVVFALAAMVTLCVSGILFWDAAAIRRAKLAERSKKFSAVGGKIEDSGTIPGFLRICEVSANAYALASVLSLSAALVLWREGLEIWPGLAALFAVICLMSHVGCKLVRSLFIPDKECEAEEKSKK